MDHFLSPLLTLLCPGRESEHDATADLSVSEVAVLASTDLSCSIYRAPAVENQTAVGVGSVAAALKSVQHFFRPLAALRRRWAQLEDRATIAAVEEIAGRSFASSKLRRPVQIACTVKHQRPSGKIAIIPALEVVQHIFRPLAALRLRRAKLERGAASRRCPEQHARTAAAVTGDPV